LDVSAEEHAEQVEHVPFATWDPDRPAENAGLHAKSVQPVRVTLEKGDMLYLPAMWFVPPGFAEAVGSVC